MRNLRTLLPVLLVAVASALTTAAPAEAKRNLGLRAQGQAEAPVKLNFTVRSSRRIARVAFIVDGDRRWVRHPRRRMVRRGVLHTRHLRPGRHRLTVRAKRRDGKIVKVTRFVRITRPPVASRVPAPPAPPARPVAAGLLDAGFEQGLANWNTAGVGDVKPTVVTDVVRSGSRAGKVALTGSEDRSELILGGNGGDGTDGTAQFREGDERFYGFSMNVRQMVYGEPGAHNLVMQFKSDGEGSPNFGLQLWDYQGKRGLWSHGDAMGGDRFLAPIAHDQWQDVVVHFKASKTGNGFYRVYLNGTLVDSRDNLSMIRSDRSYGYIKNGLYRNGDEIPGTSEIRLDAGRLGTAWEQAIAG